MVHFRSLFSCTKKEISAALQHAHVVATIHGLKLLKTRKGPFDALPHGKLLIIPVRTFKAHERNLIRRRIKSIFYEEQLYTQPTMWILIVYKQALHLSFSELKTFLTKHIPK